MKLIVGLGNIGSRYQRTRHNFGFDTIDMLAITFGYTSGDFKKHSKAPAEVLDLTKDHDSLLVKPTTMMNLSGEAVGSLVRFYKIPLEDVWVVYDDVDLELGQIRVRLGGGSAGHNGIKSIIQHVTEGFWRVRLGIANPLLGTTPTEKFVLDNFLPMEAEKVEQTLAATADLLSEATFAGIKDQTITL